MSKKVIIFGSTGTVGRKAVEAAHACGFEIIAITGHKNHTELIRQIQKYRPRYACCSDPESYEKVKSQIDCGLLLKPSESGLLLGDTERRSGVYKGVHEHSSTGSTQEETDYGGFRCDTELLHETDIDTLAKLDADCCVMAISGAASLAPTFACLGHSRRIALASKEAILLGGRLLMDMAKSCGTEIIPLDSEHNAIFQCIQDESCESIAELILTASGGAFVNYTEEELRNVELSDALKHPNWTMGPKVTIESATLMNKATEIIEASVLFDFPVDQISYIIHPESIIHSMVRFNDNSYKALLSSPDMILPIMFSLNRPLRQLHGVPPLDLVNLGKLTFRAPQEWQRRNIDLAYKVVRDGMVIAFTIANEIAVSKFMMGEIKFCEIYDTVMRMLDKCDRETVNALSDITELVDTYMSKLTR
ncbi:MAG: hypothetical protein LBJ69_03605 [Holosporales bacterium]|jgi:1-deoxy-D-xylulose-5-phosphate reductoisomerase|nr:hypothetical protein [Holosporales bacterium]